MNGALVRVITIPFPFYPPDIPIPVLIFYILFQSFFYQYVLYIIFVWFHQRIIPPCRQETFSVFVVVGMCIT